MTFVVNAINTEMGAWQLADAELSDGTRDACKQVYFQAVHGILLLGYTGLARTQSGTDMATWLSRQVTGPITTDEILGRLASQLTRLWSGFSRADFKAQTLTVSGTAFVEGRLPAYVTVGNRLPDNTPHTKFEVVTETLGRTGFVVGDGSGAPAVPVEAQAEVGDLVGVAHQTGASSKEIAAERARLVMHAQKVKGVSPWCLVVFAPRWYDSSTRLMLHGEVHVPQGEDLPKWIKPIRINAFGTDISHLTEDMQRNQSPPTSEPVYSWDIAVEDITPPAT